MKKIVVGISGGIDSAVTAAIYKEKGYDVVGLHLHVSEEDNVPNEILAQISSALNIPIEIWDLKKEFKTTVIEFFRTEHLAGRSPSPCAYCNPAFKWKYINKFAITQKAGLIASGHYITKEFNKNNWYLKKGADKQKDQSYFLWNLSEDIISKISTPLGGIEKKDTRILAAKYDLEFLTQKKESTGLCFSGELSYPELINKYIPETVNIPVGDVVNNENKKIGRHKGYIYYTIGQKRDLELDIAFNNQCVTHIDAVNNILVVDDPKSLWKISFQMKDFNFINLDEAIAHKLEVKIRGFGWNPDGYGLLKRTSHDIISVELENPAWAPAPGQPAVFYKDNLLLGGGIIYQ